MGATINYILVVIIFVLFFAIVLALYARARGQKDIVVEERFNTLDEVLDAIKVYMVDLVSDDYTFVSSNEEFDRMYKRKAKFKAALNNAVYGIDSDKAVVIRLIRDFLLENVIEEKCDELIGLDPDGEPTNNVMFEIIMYKYKQKYGKAALSKWLEKNNFDQERVAEKSKTGKDKSYYITIDDLQRSYMSENIELTQAERYDILSIILYQMYKGFGCIDTIREMDVNGLNIGASGSILSSINKDKREIETNNATSSCWLYYKGKYIHMRFIDFGTEGEVKRIVQLLVRWNTPGPLTAKRGYLVNTMYDKSRILALRPPASEYWAAFIRKFSLDDVSPEALVIKPYTINGEQCISLLEFLMRGQVTCAVTGRQGSGKTTLMSSIIRFIDPRYTIRVLEMAPELYLRELYKTRNILSLQETETVSATELQDALKKSDAAVSIVGEVATDPIAARMIQMGMTASLFTIFSHHANTPEDLVLTLRNSLVNAGGFNNMATAEKQVLDVVKVDVHLDYTASGKRYIDRITEIVPLGEGIPYPEYDENNPVNSINEITAEYYRRETDRVAFTTNLIMHYDLETDTYTFDNRFTKETEDYMKKVLGKEWGDEFELFLLENCGGLEGQSQEEVDARISELKGIISDSNFNNDFMYSEEGDINMEAFTDYTEALAGLNSLPEPDEDFNMGEFMD